MEGKVKAYHWRQHTWHAIMYQQTSKNTGGNFDEKNVAIIYTSPSHINNKQSCIYANIKASGLSLLFFVIFLWGVKCFSNFPGVVLALVLCMVVKLIAHACELVQCYRDGDEGEWKKSRAPETFYNCSVANFSAILPLCFKIGQQKWLWHRSDFKIMTIALLDLLWLSVPYLAWVMAEETLKCPGSLETRVVCAQLMPLKTNYCTGWLFDWHEL